MPGLVDQFGDPSSLRWAQQPRVQLISVAVTAKLIAPADPQRVYLLISTDGTNTLYLGNDSSVAAQRGIVLNTVFTQMKFTLQDDGIIVQLPWWGISTAAGGAQIAFITASLSAWPEQAIDNLITDTDKGAYRGIIAGRAGGSSPTKLYSNRWGQRQAAPAFRIPDE